MRQNVVRRRWKDCLNKWKGGRHAYKRCYAKACMQHATGECWNNRGHATTRHWWRCSPLTSASGLAFAYVFMFLVGGARRRCQTLLDRNYWETVKEQRGREQDQPDSGCVVVNSDLSGLQTPVRPAAGINPVTWGKSWSKTSSDRAKKEKKKRQAKI